MMNGTLEYLPYFGISFAIGFLIGLEREKSQSKGTPAIGVRSFTLFALLGTLSALLNHPALIATLSAFVFGTILLSYFRSTQTRKNMGITTEIAAAVTFCLGFLVTTSMATTLTLAAVVLLVLVGRHKLHHFSRHKLKQSELEAVIILFAFVVGVIPLLPHRTIDPWQLFNPRNFAILITLIAALQFGGHVAIRLFGHRFGMALTGFIGGLVSSTALFATLRNTLKAHSRLKYSVMGLAIFSIVATLLELAIILLAAAPSLLAAFAWPLALMISTGAMSGIALVAIDRHTTGTIQTEFSLHFISIFKLALLIGFLLILVSVAKLYLGQSGMGLIALLGGLLELHGVSLASALLTAQNQITISEAKFTLIIAVSASFISKWFLLWSLTPKSFAGLTSVILLGILGSGIVGYLFL